MKNSFEKQALRDERRAARRKGAWIRNAILIFFAVTVWCAGVAASFQSLQSALTPAGEVVVDELETDEPRYDFTEPVEEEDIFKDEDWLGLNRQINFGTESEFRAIDETSAESHGEYAEFFYRFFSSIIYGDENEYGACFSEDYPKNHLASSFTPQKLYEMYALEVGDGNVKSASGDEIPAKIFKVEYKILDNNGTFRSDLYGSGTKPEYFYLVYDEQNQLRIYSIVQIVETESSSDSDSAGGVDTRRAVISGGILFVLISLPLAVVLIWIKRRRKQEKL